jgi:hypothetical protein
LAVFGYQPEGASRTLFLFGIAVSVVTSLGLRLLLTGASPSASRAADARATSARRHRHTAFVNRDRDTRLEHQQRADLFAARRRRPNGRSKPTR